MDNNILPLLQPKKVYSKEDVFSKENPVPSKPGIYVWYFKEILPRVPIENCIKWNNKHLLYVGISPTKPPKEGKPSKQNLRKRIKNHYTGNAEGSTLRLTLGCLLSHKLGIELHRVGKGNTMTFSMKQIRKKSLLKKSATS